MQERNSPPQGGDAGARAPLDAARLPLFREEAVAEHESGRDFGEAVRISPHWAAVAYWLLFGIVTLVIGLAAICKVGEYAAGPALVVQIDELDITAPLPGVVDRVLVEQGDGVAPGDTLVRLRADDEQSVVNGLQLQLGLSMREQFYGPNNEVAAARVADLQSALNLARTRLRERMVLAPRLGLVQTVRVKSGEAVTPGQVLISMGDRVSRYQLIALLPGRYGPLVEPGQVLRLRLSGYPYSRIESPVEGTLGGVVGPAEARRLLGASLSDAVPITSPVILVRAPLQGSTFKAHDKVHRYCSGLQGVAEVRVGEERLITAMLPWIKSLVGRW